MYGLLLVEYVILFALSALILRTPNPNHGFNFIPFWSYAAILEGGPGLVEDNLLNVLVFLPVGFLMGCAFKRISWWKVLLVTCGFSICVELMQFLFSRGFAELDDVIHNTLGAVLGYGVFVVGRGVGIHQTE